MVSDHVTRSVSRSRSQTPSPVADSTKDSRSKTKRTCACSSGARAPPLSGVSALLSFTRLLALEKPRSYRNLAATAGPSRGVLPPARVPRRSAGPFPLIAGNRRAPLRALAGAQAARATWGEAAGDMRGCKVPQLALGISTEQLPLNPGASSRRGATGEARRDNEPIRRAHPWFAI